MNETNRESQNRERERGRWRKTEESKEKQNEIEPGRGEVDESKVGGMRTVETKEKRDRMKGTTRDGRRKMTVIRVIFTAMVIIIKLIVMR